jgi:hypothetical protein
MDKRAEVTDRIRDLVWELYHGLCVLCLKPATGGVHEIEPRSALPNTWDTIENRVPLCLECHELVQVNPSKYADKLRQQRDYLLEVLGEE